MRINIATKADIKSNSFSTSPLFKRVRNPPIKIIGNMNFQKKVSEVESLIF